MHQSGASHFLQHQCGKNVARYSHAGCSQDPWEGMIVRRVQFNGQRASSWHFKTISNLVKGLKTQFGRVSPLGWAWRAVLKECRTCRNAKLGQMHHGMELNGGAMPCGLVNLPLLSS